MEMVARTGHEDCQIHSDDRLDPENIPSQILLIRPWLDLHAAAAADDVDDDDDDDDDDDEDADDDCHASPSIQELPPADHQHLGNDVTTYKILLQLRLPLPDVGLHQRSMQNLAWNHPDRRDSWGSSAGSMWNLAAVALNLRPSYSVMQPSLC
jgi:hypothetical protein